MLKKTSRTRGERMRERGAAYFTGRASETKAFEKVLDMIARGEKKELQEAKTAFNIYGEGGMGKTWLLWEYERICRRRGIQPIYIDVRPWEEPRVSTIVDFLRILRKHLGQLPLQGFLGANPFADFDKSYARYMGLEEMRRVDEARHGGITPITEKLSQIGAKMVVAAGEETIPLARIATSLIGKETLQEGAAVVLEGAAGTVRDLRDRLLRLFGNAADVQFYFDHEDELINALLKASHEISKKYSLVILLDSYEELMGLDIQLRERFFKEFPEDVVLVFSGRNTIHDNCSPAWREDIHFFEMCEFSHDECQSYLRKRGIRNMALVDAIYAFTQGVPLAVALAVDASLRLPRRADAIAMFRSEQNERHLGARTKIISEVTERFLSLVPESEREIVDACAVLGQISTEGLEYLLGHKVSRDAYKRLEQYSFVRRHGPNLLFHNTVRTYLLRSLKENSPDHLRALHIKAVEYAEKKVGEASVKPEEQFESEQWRSWTLEKVYHLLQADPEAGATAFYQSFSDALWEREFEFCLSLVGLARQPLTSDIPGTDLLCAGCAACLSKDYQEARRAFRELLGLKVDSPRFYQMVHDTLGDLNSPDRLNNIAEAIQHYETAVKYFREFNEPIKVAATLFNIAECLRGTGKWEQAVLKLQESVELRRAIGDKARTAYALWWLGDTYRRWGKYAEAVIELEESRALYEELERPSSVASLWNDLGKTYRQWGKYEQAVEHYRQAQQRFEVLGERADVADVMLDLGLTYRWWGKYAESVAEFEKSQALFEELGQPSNVASLWQQLGISYREWGKYEPALRQFHEALKHFENLGERVNVANVLLSLGLTYRGWDKYAESVAELEKSRALYEELGQRGDVALVQQHLGITYREWGKFADSVRELEKSRAIYEELERPSNVAQLWNLLGITYREWGKYEQALEHYHGSLQRFEALGDRANVADVLFGLGITYREWGKYGESVVELERSRALYQELNQPSNVASLYNSLGITFHEWRKYEQAIEYYREASQRFEALGERANVANVWLGLGITYRNWGKFAESAAELEKSRALYEELERPRNVAHLWNELAITYREWGKYEQASELHREALRRFDMLGERTNAAGVLWNLGITYRNWGKFAESISELDKCHALYEEWKQASDMARVWNALGITYRDWGKYEQAFEFFQKALAKFEELEDNFYISDELLEIGRTYCQVGKVHIAIHSLNRSLAIRRELANDTNVIYVLIRIGPTLARLGQHTEATDVMKEAIELAKRRDLVEALADCYSQLIVVHRQAHQLEEARQAFAEAVRLYKLTGRHLDIADASLDLELTETEQGDSDRALQLLEHSVKTYREFRRMMKLAKALRELGQLQKRLGMDTAHKTLTECAELFDEMDCPNEAEAVRAMLTT